MAIYFRLLICIYSHNHMHAYKAGSLMYQLDVILVCILIVMSSLLLVVCSSLKGRMKLLVWIIQDLSFDSLFLSFFLKLTIKYWLTTDRSQTPFHTCILTLCQAEVWFAFLSSHLYELLTSYLTLNHALGHHFYLCFFYCSLFPSSLYLVLSFFP